jgi:predicted ester cyclase
MEPKAVVEELFRRRLAGDDRAIDDLIAENMVNHAAGPQGREGWRQILSVIGHDLGNDAKVEHHHLIAEGEFVAHHMTIRGMHRASTMPLLAGTQPTGVEVFWTYIHIWRVIDGQIIEHWACRDDVGLLRQIGAWPAATTP